MLYLRSMTKTIAASRTAANQTARTLRTAITAMGLVADDVTVRTAHYADGSMVALVILSAAGLLQRAALETIAQSHGVRVTVAGNARQCLDVVSDIIMAA